ncbi:MAG: hypothetical protein R2682_13630 [Pyrinomonadaceae bacterium]
MENSHLGRTLLRTDQECRSSFWLGHRWEEQGGKWNLEFKDTSTGEEISPLT